MMSVSVVRRRWWSLSLMVGASCWAGVPLAQTRDPADSAATSSGFDIEEIVVSARKREEKIGDVPVAITALSGEQLRARGANSLLDLPQIASGINIRQDVAGRASPSIVIRGIGFDDFRPNGSPAAAVHLDESYLGSNALLGGQLFDIERVEVLKGPQGTLYGRNTTAGAVNLISRKPTDSLEANADIDYGNYDYLRAEMGVGGPISDTLKGRIAAFYESGGGFLTNRGTAAYAGMTPAPGVPPLPLVGEQKDVGDADYLGTRATLVFEPSDASKLTLQLNYGQDRGDNSQSDVLGRSSTGFTEPDSDPYTYYGNVYPRLHSDQLGGQLRLDQDLNAVALTALASYQSLDRQYTFDPGDPRRAFDLDYDDEIKQQTAEIRLRNREPGVIDWTAGVFYFGDETDLDSLLDAADQVRSIIATDYRQTRDSWAMFAEADWHFAPRFTLTLGARYTNEESEFRGRTYDTNPWGVSIAPLAFPLPVAFDNDFSDDDVSGRIALSYKPGDSSLLYGSISRGFKSGGFDGSTIFSAPEALPFDSEQVVAYEIGAKWFDSSLPVTLTTAGFYYDFSDLQANSVRNYGIVASNVRTNVADAEVYGAELELTYQPHDDFTVGANLTWLHATVGQFVSDNVTEAARRSGNDLPDSPSLTANAHASYRIGFSNGWSLTPMLNVSHTGEHYKELDNFVAVDSYTLVNARLVLASDAAPWTLSLWGRNLTDEEYFVGLIPAATGAGVVNGVQRIAGAPATYGMSIGMRF